MHESHRNRLICFKCLKIFPSVEIKIVWLQMILDQSTKSILSKWCRKYAYINIFVYVLYIWDRTTPHTWSRLENFLFLIINVYQDQWRREDFSSGGGTLGHQKAITRPPQGVRGGGEGPRTVAKFKNLKRFKVLENESIFQKFQHFSCPKNPIFFYESFRKIEQILQKFRNFFEKLFYKFQFLWSTV